jgi:hypothetical protein
LVVVPYCMYGDLHGVLRACESQNVVVLYSEQLSWASGSRFCRRLQFSCSREGGDWSSTRAVSQPQEQHSIASANVPSLMATSCNRLLGRSGCLRGKSTVPPSLMATSCNRLLGGLGC